jgi:hypothetical protein
MRGWSGSRYPHAVVLDLTCSGLQEQEPVHDGVIPAEQQALLDAIPGARILLGS